MDATVKQTRFVFQRRYNFWLSGIFCPRNEFLNVWISLDLAHENPHVDNISRRLQPSHCVTPYHMFTGYD